MLAETICDAQTAQVLANRAHDSAGLHQHSCRANISRDTSTLASTADAALELPARWVSFFCQRAALSAPNVEHLRLLK